MSKTERSPLARGDEASDSTALIPPTGCCGSFYSPKFRITLMVALWGFLTSMERAIILPTLWLYLKTFWSLEAARNFYAGVMSSFSLAVLITTPLCGYLANKGIRSKLILLVCNQLELVGNIVYLFAPHPALVLIGRFLAGLGAGCEPPLFADLTRVTTKTERTRVIIITMLARQFGLIFGPVFTLIFEQQEIKNDKILVNVYNAPGLIMGAGWVIHTILTVIIYPNIDSNGNEIDIDYGVSVMDPRKKKRLHSYFQNVCTNQQTALDNQTKQANDNRTCCEKMRVYTKYPIVTLLMVSFACYFCLMSMETVLSPLADDLMKWNEKHVSYIYIACSLFILIVFGILHASTYVATDWALVLIGTVSLSVGYIYMTINLAVTHKPAQIYNAALILVGVAVHVFGLPFAVACSESLYTKLIPIESIDQAQSVLRTVLNTAYLLGPLVGGGLWFIGTVVFSVMAAQMIIPSILLLRKSEFIVPSEQEEQQLPSDDQDSQATEADVSFNLDADAQPK